MFNMNDITDRIKAQRNKGNLKFKTNDFKTLYLGVLDLEELL